MLHIYNYVYKLLLCTHDTCMAYIHCNNIIISPGLFILEPDVTDHIPVEDNAVYITMKKIDLQKNSAYETIIVSRRH